MSYVELLWGLLLSYGHLFYDDDVLVEAGDLLLGSLAICSACCLVIGFIGRIGPPCHRFR